jgi:hypothetical protein
MPGKRLNWRRVKTTRAYTYEEAAKRLGVHKNTVKTWVGKGLEILDGEKPHLIRGVALRTFLDNRRKISKCKCAVGQLFCLKCRKPQYPGGDMLEYHPINLLSGNLMGICPVCSTFMFRRCALAKIDAVRGRGAVSFPHGPKRIVGSA